jgi:hypothetical protein
VTENGDASVLLQVVYDHFFNLKSIYSSFSMECILAVLFNT